ncbi:MAG: ABC transporter permease [SAR202 cluster bacterium]|nr:ABC transporter permease [SAR202 cluster bacterium]
MLAYIVRRLLWLPFLLIAVSLVTFTLATKGPGDPIRVMMGNRYNEEVAQRLRHEFGLDKPFHVQYVDYISGFVRGDFGESYRYRGQNVRDLIMPKMWVSAQVALAADVIAVGLGLPLGFYIAHRQGRWQDPTAVTIALILMSIPIMVTVPVLLWAMCLKLSWIPCSGWGGLFDLRILIPAITMGVPGIAGLARFMRASTLDVLGQDFIRTAKAKGLKGPTVGTRHVFRNALIPIVTILAGSLGGLIGGAFIIERIMGIPGIGGFVIDSIFNRDYPVIMAVTIIGATAFVISNLIADVVYALVDPRIRYS